MWHTLQLYTSVSEKPVLSISQTRGTNKPITRTGCSVSYYYCVLSMRMQEHKETNNHSVTGTSVPKKLEITNKGNDGEILGEETCKQKDIKKWQFNKENP